MHTDIASSSLRELDAVALATNVTVFMKRGTKGWFWSQATSIACPFLVLELLDFLVGNLQPRLGLVVVRVLGFYRIVDLVPALGTIVKVGKVMKLKTEIGRDVGVGLLLKGQSDVQTYRFGTRFVGSPVGSFHDSRPPPTGNHNEIADATLELTD